MDRIVGQLPGHGVLLAFGLSAGMGTAGEVGVGGGLLGGGLVGGGLVGGGLVGELAGDGLVDGDGGGATRNAGEEDTLLIGVLPALVGVALPWVADGALEPTGLPEPLVLPGPLP